MQTRPPKPPLVPSLRSTGDLRERFAELEQVVGTRALAVAISDFETGMEFEFNGDRWFHAASTIKLWSASTARSIAASCCCSRASTSATAS